MKKDTNIWDHLPERELERLVEFRGLLARWDALYETREDFRRWQREHAMKLKLGRLARGLEPQLVREAWSDLVAERVKGLVGLPKDWIREGSGARAERGTMKGEGVVS